MSTQEIISIIRESCKKNAENKAIVFEEREYKYKDMLEEIESLTSKLKKECNIDKPIGLFMKNCPEFIMGYYGLINSDIVTMLVDHSLKREELLVIVNSCHLDGFLLNISEVDKFELKDEFINKIVFKNYVLLYGYKGIYDSEFNKDRLNNIVSCRFSSGTTGMPKCMMYEASNIIAAETNWKTTVKLHNKEKVMCLANYTHGLAFNTAMLAPLSEGAEIHLFNKLSPRQIAKYIQENNIQVFVAFPVLYKMMSEENLKDKYNLTSLRLCVSSGAVLHSEVKIDFKKNIGINIADLYGTAETGLCILNQSDDYDSIGKPLNNVEIKIIDDSGKALGFNEKGQIAIKSKSMARGYYNFPGLFEKKVTDDQYYLSGDIAVIKENNFIYVRGRSTDFINVAGKKVDPKELEDVMLKVENVSDVVAFKKTSKTTNDEILCLGVIPKNKTLTKEYIISYLTERVASYKIPQKIVFLNEIPRNSSGKILRRELTKMEI